MVRLVVVVVKKLSLLMRNLVLEVPNHAHTLVRPFVCLPHKGGQRSLVERRKENRSLLKSFSLPSFLSLQGKIITVSNQGSFFVGFEHFLTQTCRLDLTAAHGGARRNLLLLPLFPCRLIIVIVCQFLKN